MNVREVKKLIEHMDDETIIAVRSGPLGDAFQLGECALLPPDQKERTPRLIFELARRIGE